MNANDCLKHAVKLYGRRRAVVEGEWELTYAQLGERSQRLAGGLQRLGVRRGDVVCVLAPNCWQYFELYFGIIWAGAAIAPLNFRLAPPELAYQIDHSQAETLVIHEEYASVLDAIGGKLARVKNVVWLGRSAPPGDALPYEELLAAAPAAEVPTADADMCVLAYTGGTTGLPKGAMIPHSYLAGNALRGLGITCRWGDDEVYLHALPIFHLAQTLWVWGNSLFGGLHVVLPRFDVEQLCRLVERHRVTQAFLVTTMANALALSDHARRFDLSSLRHCSHGGSPLPPEVFRRWHDALPHVDLTQIFAQTEATFLTAYYAQQRLLDGPPELHRRLESCGRQTAGIELRVVRDDGTPVAPGGEVGELVVRHGELTMTGYWRNPEQTAATIVDGWLHTGDMGWVDDEQYVYIADRKKDMIISGGENVYSAEVEGAVIAHPAVAEVAVVGVPDDRWGERIHAVAVLKPGEQLDLDALIAHCRPLIAGYKLPRSLEIVDALPKTPMGKILKHELRARYWAGRERKIN